MGKTFIQEMVFSEESFIEKAEKEERETSPFFACGCFFREENGDF